MITSLSCRSFPAPRCQRTAVARAISCAPSCPSKHAYSQHTSMPLLLYRGYTPTCRHCCKMVRTVRSVDAVHDCSQQVPEVSPLTPTMEGEGSRVLPKTSAVTLDRCPRISARPSKYQFSFLSKPFIWPGGDEEAIHTHNRAHIQPLPGRRSL